MKDQFLTALEFLRNLRGKKEKDYSNELVSIINYILCQVPESKRVFSTMTSISTPHLPFS